MKSKLLILLVFADLVSLNLKAESLTHKAILNWNQELAPLPMLDLVFLDPEMGNDPVNKKSLSQALKKWKKYLDEQTSKANDRSKILLWQQATFLKHLNHLLVKSNYEQSVNELNGYILHDTGVQVRNKLRSVLESLLTYEVEPEEKALLLFQKYLIDFQVPSLRREAVKSVNRKSKQHLSASRKRMIQFGTHLLNLYSQEKVSKEAIQGLNHLSPYMSKEAYTLTQLYLARLKLGYNFMGEKKKKFHLTYTRHLRMISKLCSTFSQTQNSLVLSSMLAIWTKAENFEGDWNKTPFNIRCYQNLVPFLATKERTALKKWHQRKYFDAYQIYDQIAEKIHEESKQVLIQKRIISLAKVIYEKNADIAFYQGVYIKALKLSAQAQFRLQLGDELFNISKAYLNSAFRRYRSVPNLTEIVNNFLNNSTNEENSRKISVLEAKILHRDKNYEKAWKAYYKLALNSKTSAEKIHDLKEAIKNYALYCKWPQETPWTRLQEQPKPEYAKFKTLHTELLNIDSYKSSESWKTAINLGVLELIDQKVEVAYQLWKPYWDKSPKIIHINSVQGALLSKLYEDKAWNSIADILAFIKVNKLKPIHAGQPISIEKYQEKSTYEIGKQALANMELSKAEQAFGNLVNNFKSSSHYPDYLAHMIRTSRLLHRYKPLKNHLINYIAIAKNHHEFQTNLRDLIELLKGMGKVEATFTYLQKYISLYPDPKKSKEQLLLMVQLCKILPTKNYCKKIKNRRDFRTLTESANSYQIFKSRILNQIDKVKSASKNHDSKQLREIEEELTNLGKDSPVVKDTINYVWFSQIKIISDSLIGKLRSRAIKTNEAVKQYENIKQTFTGICNRKSVSSCVQSFKELLRLTTEMKSFIALSDKKQLVQNYAQLESKLRKKMKRYLARNITEPKLTQTILWETMKEWNFSEVPYTGIGYIQHVEYARKLN